MFSSQLYPPLSNPWRRPCRWGPITNFRFNEHPPHPSPLLLFHPLKFSTSTLLKVHLCGPLHLHGPLYLYWPLRFCVALSHLYRAFHCHTGPFHLREPLPPVRGLRVVYADSVTTLNIIVRRGFTLGQGAINPLPKLEPCPPNLCIQQQYAVVKPATVIQRALLEGWSGWFHDLVVVACVLRAMTKKVVYFLSCPPQIFSSRTAPDASHCQQS